MQSQTAVGCYQNLQISSQQDCSKWMVLYKINICIFLYYHIPPFFLSESLPSTNKWGLGCNLEDAEKTGR